VQTRLEPVLAAGNWVLSDRYGGSTEAYQGYGRGLDLDLIGQLEQLATAGLQPDLCLWLELPPELAAARRSGQQQDRIEAEGLAFLQRVHQGFAALSQRPAWRRVDAAASPEQVHQQVQQLVREGLELAQ
jgi:dTMP kinase